jgi:capsular polysaccharide biosynthesis protein
VPKAAQYRQYGGGRKFFCHVRHEWQREFLQLLGIAAQDILPHDPGRTYICRDVMTVEYSEADLCISAAERVNFFELAARCRVSGSPRNLFVSRRSRSQAHPGRRMLQNEAALAAALTAQGF